MGVDLREPDRRQHSNDIWPIPVVFGAAVSVVWAVITTIYACSLNDAGRSQFSVFWQSSPSDFGNALAGAFAPLAFLWLVVATFLQKHELQQSTEALHLQARELNNSVAQFTKQTELQEAAAREEEREKILKLRKDEYARIVDSLFLALAELQGPHAFGRTSYRFPTAGQNRENRNIGGTAGALAYYEPLISILNDDDQSRAMVDFCKTRPRFLALALASSDSFSSWSSIVHREQFPELNMQANAEYVSRTSEALKTITEKAFA